LAPENLDRYALAARILEHLTPELAAEGYDLLDVRIFQGGGRWQTRLYVDLLGEERITLDGCADASRSASMLLEASELFPGPWVLEVSSPGIRRPLRRVEHFEAAVGRDVEVKWRPLSAPTSRPRNLRGRLVTVADGKLEILPVTGQGEAVAGDAEATTPLSIPLAAVLEANLDRDFDVQAVIREDRRRRKDEKKARRGKRQGAADPQSELTADDERDGN
jgi:ribosome maturation factor RimP